MAGIGKKITSFFRSRKLAIVLILLIILFSIIGTHVPQKWQLKPQVYDTWKANHPVDAELFERLGLTNLFSSYIFITLAALLFINTFFCTTGMLRTSARLLARKPLFQDSAYISRLENHSVIQTGMAPDSTTGHASAVIGKILAARGYRVVQDGSRLFAEKNRFGVLAIPLFHICILLIISAGVYGAVGRMEGDIRLIEGQNVSESRENYIFINEGPFSSGNHAYFNISLDRFYPQYVDETGTERGPAGELTIIENGENVKSGLVYSNNMMDYRGFTFLNNVYGMAPLLLVLNPDGTVYTGSYIMASDTDKSGRYVAYFDLGDTGLKGGLMVYMTAPLGGEIAGTDVLNQSPIMFLKIFNKKNNNMLYDGTLRLNQTAAIPGTTGYIAFADMKYWSNFYVVRDSGVTWVYAGIALLVVAFAIHLLLVPARIWVEVRESRGDDASQIYIGGRADRFGRLYEEEFTGTVQELREGLASGSE